MAQVVYSNVIDIDAIDHADWKVGDQDSYGNTQSWLRPRDLSLVGRKPTRGAVDLVYARWGKRDWVAVNSWNLAIAKFFWAKLDEQPQGGDTLRPFFEEIDDAAVVNAVTQLVCAAVGANASDEKKKDALRVINHSISGFGVPAGDWSFLPMLEALRRA